MTDSVAGSQPVMADEVSQGRRVYTLFILLFIYTLAFIDRQIIGVLSVPIKEELNLSDTQIALMGGLAFSVFYTSVAIPVAWMADRWNRTWIISAALGIWSAFTGLCGFANSFLHLFLCRIGVGVGEAGGTTPAIALITDYFPENQRTRALSVYSWGIPGGSALGILLGGTIAAWADWRTAFFVLGVAGIALVPIFSMSVREPARRKLMVDGVAVKPMKLGALLALVGRKPTFWLMCIGASSCSVVGYGFSFWLPSFFTRSHHIPLATTAMQYGLVILVGGILGEWIGGFIADKLSKRMKNIYAVLPAVAMFSAAILYAIGLTLPTSPYLIYYFVIPIMAYFSTSGCVYQALHRLVPASGRATITSFLLFFNTVLGLGAGSMFYGLISDALKATYGAESLRYAVLAALGFLVFGALLYSLASFRVVRDEYKQA